MHQKRVKSRLHNLLRIASPDVVIHNLLQLYYGYCLDSFFFVDVWIENFEVLLLTHSQNMLSVEVTKHSLQCFLWFFGWRQFDWGKYGLSLNSLEFHWVGVTSCFGKQYFGGSSRLFWIVTCEMINPMCLHIYWYKVDESTHRLWKFHNGIV